MLHFSCRQFNEASVSFLKRLCSRLRTHRAECHKSHYLCGPRGGIPAAWGDASGTRHPRGFQPPCCPAHTQRAPRTCRDRSRPSLCPQSPNEGRGSSTGGLMVGFIGKQNNFFSFMIAERFISLGGGGWKQEMKRLTCNAQVGRGNTAHWGQRTTETFYLRRLDSCYLDNLARYKRQLLCSRLRVGRHSSRVVRVKGHKESDRWSGQLAGSLKFPFYEILRSGDPHFIWENQNIQLQTGLHWGQPECLTVRRQMASGDSRPPLTLILIWGN